MVKNEDDEVPTSSQSEKDILKNCIGLMNMVYKNMLNYMVWAGLEFPRDPDDEAYPKRSYTYFKIVNRLFLYNTKHSGGTSTRKKMEELGICENILTFEPEGDKDGTD